MKQDGWHLSRSVPATLVLGLIAQAAAIVWTVSMMMSNIEANTRDIGNITNRMQRVENMVQAQAVSMAKISTNIEHIRKAVERMASP
mgnify:CR=1 FL=1